MQADWSEGNQVSSHTHMKFFDSVFGIDHSRAEFDLSEIGSTGFYLNLFDSVLIPRAIWESIMLEKGTCIVRKFGMTSVVHDGKIEARVGLPGCLKEWRQAGKRWESKLEFLGLS